MINTTGTNRARKRAFECYAYSDGMVNNLCLRDVKTGASTASGFTLEELELIQADAGQDVPVTGADIINDQVDGLRISRRMLEYFQTRRDHLYGLYAKEAEQLRAAARSAATRTVKLRRKVERPVVKTVYKWTTEVVPLDPPVEYTVKRLKHGWARLPNGKRIPFEYEVEKKRYRYHEKRRVRVPAGTRTTMRTHYEYFMVTRVEPRLMRKLMRRQMELLNERQRARWDSLREEIGVWRADQVRRAKTVLRPMSRFRDVGELLIKQPDDTPLAPRLLEVTTTPAFGLEREHLFEFMDNWDDGKYYPHVDSFTLPIKIGNATAVIGYTHKCVWDEQAGRYRKLLLVNTLGFGADFGPTTDAGRLQECLTDPADWEPNLWEPSYKLRSLVNKVDEVDMDNSINNLQGRLQAGQLSSKDLDFVLTRSLGELKDLPQTVRQGIQFLNSMRVIASQALNPKTLALSGTKAIKTIREAASYYLAWKFGVKPTVEDVTTVLNNSYSALLTLRKSLASFINSQKDPKSDAPVNVSVRRTIERIPDRLKTNRDVWSRRRKLIIVEHKRSILFHDDLYASCEAIDPERDSFASLGLSEMQAMPLFTAELHVMDEDGSITDDPPIWTRDISLLDVRKYVKTGEPLLPEILDIKPSDLGDELGVFLANKSKVVCTGQFALKDLLKLMDESLTLVGNATEAAFSTAWELTPLSFVLDWFGDFRRIFNDLDNRLTAMRTGVESSVPIQTGIKHELYACAERLAVSGSVKGHYFNNCVEAAKPTIAIYKGSWDGAQTERLELQPPGLTMQCNYVIDFTSSITASVTPWQKTGIVRYERGTFVPETTSIQRYLPRLNVNFDRGKLSSLIAMLASKPGTP